MYVFPAVF
jgi:hypothetical protein